jgi:hypothetical protein
MAIQIIGYGGVIADVDGSTYQALKVTQRPVDYTLRGSYRLSVATGTFSAVSYTNGSVFQFYWPSATETCLVWGVMLDFNGSSPAAGANQAKLWIVRSVTANGTGGTTITVPGTQGNNQQLRTSMRPSLASPILVSTTSALNNGTWTQDSTPLGSATFGENASGVNVSVLTQFRLYGTLAHRSEAPIVLGQGEGLNVTVSTPTGPTFVVGVTVSWSEVRYY